MGERYVPLRARQPGRTAGPPLPNRPMVQGLRNRDAVPHLMRGGTSMPVEAEDPLTRLSDAMAARAAAASGLVVCIHAAGSGPRSGILWRNDVVVASAQVFPKTDPAEIVVAHGKRVSAPLARPHRRTNPVPLRLRTPGEGPPP